MMDNKEKATQVQKMFSQISDRYDLLNRLLSFGVDRYWRNIATKEIIASQPDKVLDVATGTGDLALEIKKALPQAEVTGLDFVENMLNIARQKAERLDLMIKFENGDALNINYADNGFDVVSCAFGFRNFADYQRGLSEFYRVLKPDGKVIILEFPPPPKGFLGQFYRIYFQQILPFIGGLISGKPEAYRYLPNSVLNFPEPLVLQQMMDKTGFKTKYKLLTGGLVAIHVGLKTGQNGSS